MPYGMTSRKKITDIFQERVVSRKERNSYGEWEVVDRPYRVRRPVEGLWSPLRVANYFVDMFAITLIIMLVDFLIGSDQRSTLSFITIMTYFGYYALTEFYFQRTIGKYLTNSLVINEYGERPDFKTVCLRTLTRIIPLDPYSFFWTNDHRLWHDTWTETFVVSNAEVSLIRRIQSGEKPGKSDEGQWDEWHRWQ
jgi:uncharacterized RDD family membrane protein YckC